MANATIDLKASANPPVFSMPTSIVFNTLPVVGHSFVFTTPADGGVFTSTVQKIDYKDGEYLITTHNSTYSLKP